MTCGTGNHLNHPIDNIYSMPDITPIHASSLDFVQACDNLERAREISDHLPVYLEFKIEDKNEF